MENKKNLPKKTIRVGAIAATIWKNEITNNNEKTFYFSVSLNRNYKDKDGNWKNTTSLRSSDLPKAMLVLNKAYEFLMLECPNTYVDRTKSNSNSTPTTSSQQEPVVDVEDIM